MHVCFTVHVWFSKIRAFNFFCLLNFFTFLYELACQNIHARHDRHNKTLRTTDSFNSCVLSCTLFIQKSSSIFHTEQSCDRLKFDTSAAQKKTKQNKNVKKKKMHLGQVFQSVTSVETLNFFLPYMSSMYSFRGVNKVIWHWHFFFFVVKQLGTLLICRFQSFKLVSVMIWDVDLHV